MKIESASVGHLSLRHVSWAVLAALTIAALVWAFLPRATAVDVAAVQIGRFEQVIEQDGRLRAKQRYLITAPMASELARPTLKVGDSVRAGQVVAVLTPVAPQMIDARTRRVLQERVGQAEAALAMAAAQVERLQAAVAQARLEDERAQQLASQNFVAASARDQAALALRGQQKAYDAAQAERHAAEHALRESRLALSLAQQGADAPRGRWELSSPVAGQVIKLHQESGGPLAVGQPILEIADASAFEAVIDVLSGDALRLHVGAPVQLSLGSGTPAAVGHVSRIEPVAFTKVSALGIEEQRVNVLADFDLAPALPLGEGFRVDARLTVSAHDGALLLPAAALLRDGARWAAFVVAEGRLHRRGVELRDRNADWAWVAGGFTAGENVVVYPAPELADGQRVEIRTSGASR